MHLTIKRLIAYIFDLFVVMFVAQTLSMTPLNPNYDDIVDLQTEYQTKQEEVTERMKEMSDEDAQKEFDEFYVYYKDAFKRVSQLNIYDDIITIVLLFLYYVVFVYFFDGETVGKRLVKLKIVDKDDNKASVWRLALRVCILYEIPFTVWNLVASFILSNDAFAKSYSIMYTLTSAIMLGIAITVAFSKDKRGLHDMISGTKVVERK